MLILVSVAAALAGVSRLANAALEGFLHRVTQLMFLQRVAPAKFLLTVDTLEFLTKVCPLTVELVHVLLMTLAATLGCIPRAADAALVGFCLEVCLLMLSQPLLAGESFIADLTLERIDVHLLMFPQSLASLEFFPTKYTFVFRREIRVFRLIWLKVKFQLVPLQASHGRVSPLAEPTLVGFGDDMRLFVFLEILTASEFFPTDCTFKRIEMSRLVLAKTLAPCEFFTTNPALVRIQMSQLMFQQSLSVCKPFCANPAPRLGS